MNSSAMDQGQLYWGEVYFLYIEEWLFIAYLVSMRAGIA
jgi:hypothetical protein